MAAQQIHIDQLIQGTIQCLQLWSVYAAALISNAVGGPVVSAGPFKGLLYDGNTHLTMAAAKLLGCYEEETFVCLETAIAMNPPRVINIGAAEGYYALGAAMRLPHAEVIAFEASDSLRNACEQLIDVNRLSGRIQLGGFCSLAELKTYLIPSTWLIVDIEGGELDLLQPNLLPALAHTTMLVETHDFAKPGTTAELFSRFSASHEIAHISQRARLAADYPLFVQIAPPSAWWSGVLFEMAISELRAIDQAWLYMRPRKLAGL